MEGEIREESTREDEARSLGIHALTQEDQHHLIVEDVGDRTFNGTAPKLR